MANSATIDAIQEARAKARESGAEVQQTADALKSGKVVDFRSTTPPAQDETKQVPPDDGNLDSPETQRDIMHPEVITLPLSFGNIDVHKLTSRQQVQFQGYALSVIAAAGQKPQNGNAAIGLMTLHAVLAEQDALGMKLCYFLALSTFETGKADVGQALKLGAEFFHNSTMKDFGIMYATFAAMTDFDTVLKDYVAKKQQPAEDKKK